MINKEMLMFSAVKNDNMTDLRDYLEKGFDVNAQFEGSYLIH